MSLHSSRLRVALWRESADLMDRRQVDQLRQLIERRKPEVLEPHHLQRSEILLRSEEATPCHSKTLWWDRLHRSDSAQLLPLHIGLTRFLLRIEPAPWQLLSYGSLTEQTVPLPQSYLPIWWLLDVFDYQEVTMRRSMISHCLIAESG
jgi:hypothetical protein